MFGWSVAPGTQPRMSRRSSTAASAVTSTSPAPDGIRAVETVVVPAATGNACPPRVTVVAWVATAVSVTWTVRTPSTGMPPRPVSPKVAGVVGPTVT